MGCSGETSHEQCINELFRNNSKAILAKAEALFLQGEFEMSLVQFYRGWNVRHDLALKVECRIA